MLFEGSSQFLKQTVAKKAIYMATTNLHSMAKANLNKAENFLKNITAAYQIEYIPK